jgi:hypothetical protein
MTIGASCPCPNPGSGYPILQIEYLPIVRRDNHNIIQGDPFSPPFRSTQVVLAFKISAAIFPIASPSSGDEF